MSSSDSSFSMGSVSLITNSSLRCMCRPLPDSFSSSLVSSAAAPVPAPAAAPPAAGAAAAPPPEPTFSSRSLTSLPSSAWRCLSAFFSPCPAYFTGSIPLQTTLSRLARRPPHWRPLLGSEVYRPMRYCWQPLNAHNWGTYSNINAIISEDESCVAGRKFCSRHCDVVGVRIASSYESFRCENAGGLLATRNSAKS